MCTRLAKNAWVHHRWFASKIFDRQRPFQVNATFRRETPKEVPDVYFKFGLYPIFTDKISFIKEKSWRYEDEHQAYGRADGVNNGTYCMKCGHPSKCEKKMFKKWD
ncbi:Hypothetical protein HVR_LOCUS707 [uncultured virus]|nr:Hypothetical protein HVR_LOCUS707 [uncultured virus]